MTKQHRGCFYPNGVLTESDGLPPPFGGTFDSGTLRISGFNYRYVSTVSASHLHVALRYAGLSDDAESWKYDDVTDHAYNSSGAFSRCGEMMDDPQSFVSQIKLKQDTYYNQIPVRLRTLLDKPFQVLFGFFPLKRYARLHVTLGEDGENIFLDGFYPEEISCVLYPTPNYN